MHESKFAAHSLFDDAPESLLRESIRMSTKRSRVHPKYKTKYRVRNWAEYDCGLVRRGDITIWFSDDAGDLDGGEDGPTRSTITTTRPGHEADEDDEPDQTTCSE